MRIQRLLFLVLAGALATSVVQTQPGRGGSQWLTAFGDAQRTSWIRYDDKISVASMAQPGFDLQWKVRLDNQPRGVRNLAQGVTASGVTLFVPMSIVAGSSNNVYAIDNDIGYVVWQRQFDVVMPAPTPACPGGITSATRIVRLEASATAGAPAVTSGRGAVGYRSLLGEPGEGVPVEGRAAARGRGTDPAAPGRGAARGAGAGGARGGGRSPQPPLPGARGAQGVDRIPGAPRMEEGGAFGMLFRPSGVAYVVSSDGMLHVLGLPSGKDIQRPAPFLPANARWSAPIAVGTTMYAATSGRCGGAPDGIWAIDLDSEAKPVVSWKTNGGGVVGALAFTSDGTLIAAIGPGQTAGDGKANAVVALDAKTLQVKDWFTRPDAEFVTGPTILRHGDREVVAAATKDGRVLLLDAASLGGADHGTPLLASKTFIGTNAAVSADTLAAWQQTSAPAAPDAGAVSSGAPQPAPAGPSSFTGASWILLPVSGRPAAGLPSTNGAAAAGAVVALRLTGGGSALTLEPGWVSHNLSAPATPLVVNGVVFTLATGAPSSGSAGGTPAVLHAYEGGSGKRLWNSGKAMSAFASPGSLWSGLGQIYVGTHDGTLYAFGFNDERRYTSGG